MTVPEWPTTARRVSSMSSPGRPSRAVMTKLTSVASSARWVRSRGKPRAGSSRGNDGAATTYPDDARVEQNRW